MGSQNVGGVLPGVYSPGFGRLGWAFVIYNTTVVVKTMRFVAVKKDTYPAVVGLRWLGMCVPRGVAPTQQLGTYHT